VESGLPAETGEPGGVWWSLPWSPLQVQKHGFISCPHAIPTAMRKKEAGLLPYIVQCWAILKGAVINVFIMFSTSSFAQLQFHGKHHIVVIKLYKQR
jgi:hypothetical protein